MLKRDGLRYKMNFGDLRPSKIRPSGIKQQMAVSIGNADAFPSGVII